jgi:Tol biopolymer transport system component
VRLGILRISRILTGPVKGTLILLAIAAALGIGLMAIEGRFIPKKPAVDKIAFISNRSGSPGLWLMNTDGSSAQRLAVEASNPASPAWSADGTKIVFTAYHNGVAQIFAIEAMKPSKAQLLTAGSGVKLRPSFSSDGSRILYMSQGRVFAMNSDGSDIGPLLPPEQTSQAAESLRIVKSPYLDADWSADGESVAAVQELEGIQVPQTLMTMTSEPEVVTDLDKRPLTGEKVYVKWATKGKKLAVAASAGPKGVLVVRDYDTDSFTFVAGGIAVGRMAWSPNGEQIAFEVLGYREGHGYSVKGLAVAEVASGKQTTIAKGETTSPSWTANGRLIIFTLTRKDGLHDVCSVSPDGTGLRRLSLGKGDDYDAVASPARAE